MIEEVSVTNLSDVNSAQEDFVAVPFGQGIMFNSFANKNKCDTCGYFYNLRFAAKKDGMDCSFSPPVPVKAQIKTKYNYGTPTFSMDGKKMILSQNYNVPGGEGANRGKKLQLVTAEMTEENGWANFTALPFNMVDYETTHPSLSADGQKLYFASNRPGGQGGMDIWMVARQGDTWGNPTNLGPTINSSENEIFPSISKDGTLHFSSNRAGGLGQLDVYSSSMEGGSWSSPENLGRPINSTADEIGYVTVGDGESGYLTSNRDGGRGKDDLYCWKINKAPVLLAVEDATNAKRLPGSKVTIKGPAQSLNYDTDAEGSAQPDITFRRTYTINVEKEGYEPWSKEVTAKELAAVETYIVPLTPRAYQMIGDVKLIGSETIVPGSRVVLHNITTGEKREYIADENAKFHFDNIHCFEDYELIAYKDDRESERYPLPASAIDCASSEPTSLTLRLPVPPPVAPVCNCTDAGILSLPIGETPKSIHTLGSRPQFGNSHHLDATGFYEKLKKRHEVSKRDAKFLDELFNAMGYENGFADVGAYTFSETTIENGKTGNMGYTKAHRIKYVQLNAKRDRDLQAFRVASANGCDVYFMKTCGNVFFFCSAE
jgi:hypothetical protein